MVGQRPLKAFIGVRSPARQPHCMSWKGCLAASPIFSFMPPQKIVIHLSGPSCSGKSTLNQALGEKLPGLYTVSYDKQKWQLAGYDRDRNTYEFIAKKGISMQLDFFFRRETDYRHCKDIAEKFGYKFFRPISAAGHTML